MSYIMRTVAARFWHETSTFVLLSTSWVTIAIYMSYIFLTIGVCSARCLEISSIPIVYNGNLSNQRYTTSEGSRKENEISDNPTPTITNAENIELI